MRYPDIDIDSSKCSAVLSASLRRTKYKYITSDSTAPLITNCVTAVRYFLDKGSEKKLPPVFIGDMPRILVTLCGCTVKKIKLSEMRFGDLIFFKWDSSNQTRLNRRYICHIAVALGPGVIFHSAQDRGGGSIDNLAMPTDLYARTMLTEVIDQPFLFLRYIDPRNKKLRDEFETDFIPFQIPKPVTEKGLISLIKMRNRIAKKLQLRAKHAQT